MKKLLTSSVHVFLLVLAMVGTGRADAGSSSIEERFKTSINVMVQKVERAENPSEKREIIGAFLLRMDRGMAMVQTFQSLSHEDEAGIVSARDKIHAQYEDLKGLNGHVKVSDADLNSYAAYIQQAMEQADAYWTDGGLYISVGTLILILIIILILK